jgi:menaquinone-9 beta-reductase
MMRPPAKYDVIVVGARCAGAALATLLARRGARVLLLERDRLGSDQVLSTHTIHPPGMEILDAIGAGDAVRSAAPPMTAIRIGKSGTFVEVEYGEGRAEYCPRRQRLDSLLQNAASAAGVELLERTRVTALVREEGRVTGVRAIGAEGEMEWHAGLVVGADGRRSTVAALAGADEYLAYDAPRAMYWGYWSVPQPEENGRRVMYIHNDQGRVRVVFHTDGGELLIGSLPPVAEALLWRASPREALERDLKADRHIRPLIERGELGGSIRGALRERFFFRRGAGPGWALAGDAGIHKEFIIGDGITEALIQAESLAGAIAEGSDAALERWWRARDVAALPMYCFGEDEGKTCAPPELQRIMIGVASARPDLRLRLSEVMEHRRSPYDVFPLKEVVRAAAGSLLRGKVGVAAEFVAMGKRASAVGRELRVRQRLLERAGM